MEWQTDSTLQVDTTGVGSCEGVVKQTSGTVWTAFVSRSGNQIAHDSFSSLEDARAWCEMHLKQYQEEKLCGS